MFAILVSAQVLYAERIIRDDYEASAARADTHINFDDLFQGYKLPRRIDTLLELDCLTFGERFAGQTLTQFSVGAFPSERVSDKPSAPLTVVAGSARSNLAVYRNRGFDRISLGGVSEGANGEGALAIRFNEVQAHFGFAYYAGSKDENPFTGWLHMKIFDQDARLLANLSIQLRHSSTVAFKTRSGAPAIAGISLHNSDPEGMSMFDFHATCHGVPVS